MNSESNLLTLAPGHMTLDNLRAIFEGGVKIELDPACRDMVDDSAEVVQTILKEGRTVYGINTGFGRLAQEVIPADKLEQLQRNLVLSHSTGTGTLLGDDIVRLVMAMKAASWHAGFPACAWW